jgi:hypothetical protein
MHECISKQREKLEMNFRLTRRRLLVTGITSALFAVAAWAEGVQVIHFAAPESVTTGQNVPLTIQGAQAPTVFTFTSYPAGLVNYTATVTASSQVISVPTNGLAPVGTYTLIATPANGPSSTNSTYAHH